MAENAENLAALTARMHGMAISCQRGKGDATSHYAARWLRLAAAVGSVKWPSSRRPSPTTNVTITNHFCQLYRQYRVGKQVEELVTFSLPHETAGAKVDDYHRFFVKDGYGDDACEECAAQ